MAFDTLTNRPVTFTRQLLFDMASHAQAVELLPQQFVQVFVGKVTMHANAATRVIGVVVMAIDAVESFVIDVRKGHRQYRLRTSPKMAGLRSLRRCGRAHGQYQQSEHSECDRTQLHAQKFRTRTNVEVAIAVMPRNSQGDRALNSLFCLLNL